MKASLMLADLKGGYLYQSRPDIFPEGYLTDTEIGLWVKYYEMKERRLKKNG